MNCGFRPVTGRTSGGKPYRVGSRLNIGELTSRTRCRLCREKGHWASACPNRGKQVPRDGEEAKTSFFVYFKLILEQSDEIFGVSQISWENSPWKQLSLVNDEESISLSHATVLYSQILC